jgi:hypothetical protein
MSVTLVNNFLSSSVGGPLQLQALHLHSPVGDEHGTVAVSGKTEMFDRPAHGGFATTSAQVSCGLQTCMELWPALDPAACHVHAAVHLMLPAI